MPTQYIRALTLVATCVALSSTASFAASGSPSGQRPSNRSAAEAIPRSASGATRDEQPALWQVASDLKWRMIGPFRGGRTRAVAGVPTQPDVFYIGAVDGGVWKTSDAGRTWQPIFDAQPTQSIGAIGVAPSDPNILYVGSGEGLHRPDLSVGDGIYRSADAGRTWTHMGLRDGQQIADLAIDPHDPNRVFVAVLGHPYGPNSERGIYRSLDAGQSWQQVLFKDENTGGSAVTLDPSHPQVVYATLWQDRLGPWEDKNQFQGTGGGLFKSTDGGATWHKLTRGLPDNTSQVNLTICASQPDRIYAVVGTNEPGEYSSAAGLGVFRSDDAGESWTRITTDPRPALRIGGGDLPVLRVDPKNPDVVYSAGLVTMKSVDGGRQWQPLRGAPGGDDYQNLWINPTNPDIIALVSDQGAVVTLNGGSTWSSWLNQPTAQLYHVSTAPTFPYRVCAGQQESGSLCIASRGNDGSVTQRDWHPVGAIEYGYVAPDPLDPDVVYGAGRTNVSKFHWSTGLVEDVTPIPVKGAGDRADRTEPLLFSPTDPHTLYYAANKLYRTRDGGRSWDTISPDLTREQPGIPASVGTMHQPNIEKQRGAIYALGVSPRNGDILWAGTDDGLIWLSRDGGKNWSNITPPALTPWSKVTQIEASHFDADTAYVSVSRMRIDDMHPYVFRTRDRGQTWESISAGLTADAPVNAVREDTQRRGLLFAATETTVWASLDDGAHWDSLQLNLPHTSMRDLAIHDDDLILGTHGRSIWILDDISPLRQIDTVHLKQAALLRPAPAYRVARSTWTDTPIPPDEPLGTNPPAGAVIDYFLPRDAKGVVTLEILDGTGELVRRFRSDDPPDMSEEELARELIPQYWIAMPRILPKTAGMHRWVWDMHYPAPTSTTRGFPISAVPHATPRLPLGPLAVSGNYRIRLTVDGRQLEQPLALQADPRVHASPEDLQQQFELSATVARLLTRSSQALLEAQSQQKQLQELKASGAAEQAVKDFSTRLASLLEAKAAPTSATPASAGTTKEEGRIVLSEVQEHLGTLYTAVTGGAAAPTAAQVAAVRSADRDVERLEQQWQQLQARLPALNKILRQARLAPVRTGLAPPRDLNAADED
jgi:photosystem II stability/assembly factor-like uncharacterized protein